MTAQEKVTRDESSHSGPCAPQKIPFSILRERTIDAISLNSRAGLRQHIDRMIGEIAEYYGKNMFDISVSNAQMLARFVMELSLSLGLEEVTNKNLKMIINFFDQTKPVIDLASLPNCCVELTRGNLRPLMRKMGIHWLGTYGSNEAETAFCGILACHLYGRCFTFDTMIGQFESARQELYLQNLTYDAYSDGIGQ